MELEFKDEQGYFEIFGRIAEKALEAHEATNVAMYLEQVSDMADELYQIGNNKRREIVAELVVLDRQRYELSGEDNKLIIDWFKFPKRIKRCFGLARELAVYQLLIEDLMMMRSNEDEFARELDELNDLYTDKEFELQYKMIKSVPKQRRGW